MRMLIALLACLVLSTPASAQQQQSQQEDESTYIVKTIPLRKLSSTDAMLLLTPYVARRGAVYTAGTTIRAVTVRASPKTVAEVEKILAQYDRSPETVSLRFQLIAADYSNTRDPSVAGLDSVLRGVLKFTGYRRLSTTIANVDGGRDARLTMSGDGSDFSLYYSVDDVTEGSQGTIRLRVSLSRLGPQMVGVKSTSSENQLMSTGLTIPDGHTVVLGSVVEKGSASPGQTNSTTPSERALILTVTPQIQAIKKEN